MTPPRLAAWLLSHVCPASERDDLLASLEDEASLILTARGISAARGWYWRQTLGSVVPLLGRRLTLVQQAVIPHSAGGTMSHVWADLSFWLRRLRRRPLLPAIVLVTMAGGIAAATAVFSVANAVLFSPLPLPDSDRIVRFYTDLPRPGVVGSINLPDLTDVAGASRTLAAVAPFSTTAVTWQRPPAPESLAAVRVGPRYLEALGLKVHAGRWFDPSEFGAGTDAVAVLTDGFWRRAFGGRDDAVGQMLDLDDRHVRIVGVLEPSAFLFPASADLWLPLSIDPSSYLNGRVPVRLAALGRIRADRSMEAATAELSTLNRALQVAYPHESGRRTLLMRRLRDTLAGPVRPTIVLLIAAVSIVLLLSAANIGDALLSEAASRRSEFAIRLAMGAGRARLTRQVLVETGALLGLGGALGLALAPLVTEVLVTSYPTPLPRVAEIGLSVRAFGAGVGATVVAALLAVAPLVRVGRRLGLAAELHDGGRGAVSPGSGRLTAALVTVQVALSLMLLSCGVLLARTFIDAESTQVGFDPSGVLTFSVSLPTGPQADPVRAATFFADVGDRLRTLPGVRAVGATMFLPFAPGMWGDNFARVGTAADVAPRLPAANLEVITPGYATAIGTALLKGRLLTAQDTHTAARVVLVNGALEKHWLDGAALGRRLVWGTQTWEVVGVLGDVKRTSVAEAPGDELYFPWTQFPFAESAAWMVVRAEDGPSLLAMLPRIRSEISAMNPLVPVTRAGLLEARLSDVVSPERFRATLAGALGLAALLLAVLGVGGMLAHRVAAQTREIGVRLALGEPASRVWHRVVLSGLRLSGVGIGLGLLLSLWAAPLLQTFLTTGRRANDPTTLLVVSTGLLLLATAAAWIPARRASRVDPLTALRVE
jgi:putative ABC transport system permease protein